MEKINLDNSTNELAAKNSKEIIAPTTEDNKNETEKKPEKNNVFKGHFDFRDMPGYAPDHKNGYNKYDSQIEFEKNSKLLETAEKNLESSEIGEAHQKTKEKVKEEAKEKATALSIFRKIGNSMSAKIALLSLMLFAKAGESYATNANDKDIALKNKLELTTDNEKTPLNEAETLSKEDNYFGEYKDFETGTKLEATNYFVTDKAEINQENQEKLAEDFSKFLETINDHNFKEIIEKSWVIKGSSDERKTNNWDGNNEELTKARIKAVNQTLKETLKNHDFDKNLSPENAAVLKAKEINESYPTTKEPGKENGVTYLTDLKNKETGKNYKDQEIENIKKNDEARYLKMLEECRYTNFELESNYFELAKYDQVHFLVDESGSMHASKSFIAEKLKNIEFNKPITLMSFSDQLNPDSKLTCANNLEAAEKIIKDSQGGAITENQVISGLSYLSELAQKAVENRKNGLEVTRQKVYIATDEALQNVNTTDLELLKYQAEEANADVEFLLGYDPKYDNTLSAEEKKGKAMVIKISLEDLMSDVALLENDAAGDKEGQVEQKMDNVYYQKKYQESISDFEKALDSDMGLNFKYMMKRNGYGSTTTEIRTNLDNELSGPGGYANITKVLKGINMNISERNDNAIGESANETIKYLKPMIRAHNRMDEMVKILQNVPSDKIPNTKDNITIKNINKFKTKDGKTLNILTVGPHANQAYLAN